MEPLGNTFSQSPRPPLPPGPYLVAGLGRAGTAAAEALVRLRPAARISAHDRDPGRVEAFAAARDSASMDLHGGGDGLELLDSEPRPAVLVKSPGIRQSAPLVQAALSRGLTVLDEAELAWRLDRRPWVGVTGTNGKSTVVALLTEILRVAGAKPVLAGNTEFGPPLSEALAAAGEVVVAELSSFQLAGSPELMPELGVLTNVRVEHLEWHGGRKAYADAKRRLLLRKGRTPALSVVPVDDVTGLNLAREVLRRGGRVARYGGTARADWRLVSSDWDLAGGVVGIAGPEGMRLELATKLAGEHNAANVTAAVALALSAGLDREAVAAGVRSCPAVPGRLERVGGAAPFEVVVDYAHNADGVAAALAALRPLVRFGASLRAVVSASPFRTVQEQEALGRAAAEHADQLVATTDRVKLSERTLEVARRIAGAATAAPVELVADRRTAIELALARAVKGDVVVVLGRGARSGPQCDDAGVARPFDDRRVCRELLSERDRLSPEAAP